MVGRREKLRVDKVHVSSVSSHQVKKNREAKKNMPDDFSVKLVKKFDGTNFQGWKFQLTAVLMANEIFDVVDGTRRRPPDQEGVNEGRTKIWVKDNAKATAIIAAALEYEQLDSIIVCTTAKAMWDKLSAMHEQRIASNVVSLTQRFYGYRMSSNDSVIQHVSHIQNLARQLSDLGQPVNEVGVIAKILESLTSKYTVLKTAWDSVEPNRQTVENLLERLIREENRLKDEDDSASAFAVTRHNNTKNEEKYKGEKKKNNRSKKDIECYGCHEKGHYASKCPRRKNNSENKSSSSSNCAFVLSTETSNNTKPTVKEGNKSPSVEQTQRLLQADKNDVWITDSGASAHITFRREWLVNFRSVSGEKISLGDDGECDVIGTGTAPIEKLVNGKWQNSVIENVLFVPQVTKNLLSVGVCTNRSFRVSFENGSVEMSRNGHIEATGVKQTNCLYRMFFRAPSQDNRNETNIAAIDLKIWHERLGHIHKRALHELVNRELVNGVNLKNIKDFFCESCQFGKLHKLPFKTETERRATKPGQFIHSDVCGPVPVQSPGGARFYVLFKDDATGYRFVYFVRHKSDVFEKFKEFERLVYNKFKHPMQTLRTDNGTEYCNERMREYMKLRGITHETTALYTPEQNGRAERDNRTIVESARTMMQARKISANL